MMAFREQTVIAVNDPFHGGGHLAQTTLEGVSLNPMGTELILDGKRRVIFQPVRIDVDTNARTITTTITVLPED